MKKYTLLFVCLFSFAETVVSQNVGIGSTSPSGKLHVKGGANVSQLIIDAHSTQGNTNPLIKLRHSDGIDLMWIHADNPTNIFVGLNAGRVNNSASMGLNNTFIGSDAGYANTTGAFNTANGNNALHFNTTGGYNTATGSGALFSNTTGINNTATGSYSLVSNTTGANNTSNGSGSLFSNTTGFNNTAIGQEALYILGTGNNNTAIGYKADVASANIVNATAIGSNALAGASNSVVIGSVNGINGATANTNVGMGTSTPHSSAALEVKSTDKGVLVPRIALTSANTASPVTSPADALLIYNTATAGMGANAVVPGFYHWKSSTSRWTPISESSSNGSAGYGSWGDCGFNSVSEYNPVADETGVNGDQFGTSVSISGNFAIIGAMQDDEPLGNQGSASLYQFNGMNWDFMQKITDSPGESSAYYGISVCISGTYAIVGAIYDGPLNEGSASIYQYNGTNWVLMQKLTDTSPILQEYFGVSVSISGNFALVGAYRDDVGGGPTQGSAFLYQYNGTNWVLMQQIVDATGEVGDWFGGSVSLSGNYAIIGAANDDVGTNVNQGSVSIYQYNGTSWILMQKITDATGGAGDLFGSSVSISDVYTIVGAQRDDVGTNTDQGSASIYKFNGTNWVLMQTLVDPAGTPNDYFGYGVSISGNFAMVGAIWDDIGSNTNQGSATIYQKVGAGWQKLQYLTDPGGGMDQLYGASVAMDNSTMRFVVGAVGYLTGTGKVTFGKTN